MGTAKKVVNGITGKTQADAANSAARTQSDASKYAADLAYKQFQENKSSLAPFVNSGYGSVNSLSSLLSPGGQLYDTAFTSEDFQNFKDPSYDWRVKQGQNAIASQAAAAGNYGSGNMGTALVDYGQNAASQEYSNAYQRYMNSQNTLYDRLYNMSALGSNAATNTATMGAQSAAQQGDFATQGANAIAAGTNNAAAYQTNAINGLLNQGMSAYGSGALAGSGNAMAGLGSDLYALMFL